MCDVIDKYNLEIRVQVMKSSNTKRVIESFFSFDLSSAALLLSSDETLLIHVLRPTYQ